jgi:low temperature requirement protein LtrA
MRGAGAGNLFRARKPDEQGRVTSIELFYDLVFVFAITQLSHLLLAHFTLRGVFETTLLLLAVWWVWIYTSWTTNWLDPERTPVRLLLVLLTLAGLVLSATIPKAFETRGLAFAGAYVAMQLGRTAFVMWATASQNRALLRTFQRIFAWFLAAAVLWIAGGFVEGDARLAIWSAAVALEYMGPAFRFRTPGLGASALSDWTIEGGHFAERCGLFIIIALGESVVVTGATFSQSAWVVETSAALAITFAGSVAMWWIYFDRAAEAGSHRLIRVADPGGLARIAYTYFHLPIVAGIILTAVADDMILAHPTGALGAPMVIATVGGPLLFLLGNILFKRMIRGWIQLSHLGGIALLLAMVPAAPWLPPVAFGALVALVLVIVAVWETLTLPQA